MSAFGTKRRFAATQQLRRFQGEAWQLRRPTIRQWKDLTVDAHDGWRPKNWAH
jgi:hypothetical protein